jgi:hypothetical protein
VTKETQQYLSISIVVGVDVGVDITKVLIVAMEMQQWVLFTVLSSHIFHIAFDSNEYFVCVCVCVCVVLSSLSGMRIASSLRHFIL